MNSIGRSIIMMNDSWTKTACILCSVNCGLEVKVEGRRITRVRAAIARPVRGA